MRSFKNIGASDYRRYTNELVRFGESFTCSSEREQSIVETEGAIGIRLEEVFPAELSPVDDTAETSPVGDTLVDAPLTLGELVAGDEVDVSDREDTDVEVTPQGAQRKRGSSKSSKRSSRR